jgi:hypothetical protein
MPTPAFSLLGSRLNLKMNQIFFFVRRIGGLFLLSETQSVNHFVTPTPKKIRSPVKHIDLCKSTLKMSKAHFKSEVTKTCLITLQMNKINKILSYYIINVKKLQKHALLSYKCIKLTKICLIFTVYFVLNLHSSEPELSIAVEKSSPKSLPTFVIFLQLPHRRKFAKSGQPDQGTN